MHQKERHAPPREATEDDAQGCNSRPTHYPVHGQKLTAAEMVARAQALLDCGDLEDGDDER